MKKLATIIIVLSSIWLCTKAQYQFFEYNGDYTYFIGNKEPDPNWKKPDFDDSAWQKGEGTIGYGDNDDTTIIEQTRSVYLRISFYIEDTAAFQIGSFNADFDDGFVAYLNGVEIARRYLGEKGDFIPHSRLADRSHEACYYRNYYKPCQGTYLDNDVLGFSKKPGKNVLAVQVHNDSISGSDLTFRSTLYNLTYLVYGYYNRPWRARKYVQFDSTKFPIVVINTDEYQLPTKKLREVAQMGVINNNGHYNKLTDPYNEYKGRIWIERKGQSSSDFPKMSYNLETQDEYGNDLDVSLLGLPAESDWVLTGAFADKSLFRNELMYYLGRELGDYAPRTSFCEVFVNGQYMGLYSLIERIKIGKNRVDVKKLDKEDRFGSNVTGGYLYKFDKDAHDGKMVDPDRDTSPVEQDEYINNFIQEYLYVVEIPAFDDPVIGYTSYIDTKSLINYTILNEITKNADAYLYSMYLNKDRNGKVKFGPLWDYDLGFGNCTFQEGERTYGWQFEYNTKMKIQNALADTQLVDDLNTRWWELRQGILHTDSLFSLIDEFADSIEEARIRNYICWPVIDKVIFHPNYFSTTYENELELMKAWIYERLIWIDENIGEIYYERPKEKIVPVYSIEANNNFVQIYPNPAAEFIQIESSTKFKENTKFQLYNLQGNLILTKNASVETNHQTIDFRSHGLQSGVYMLVVSSKDDLLFRSRIIKQ